jgi:hypothetical protein
MSGVATASLTPVSVVAHRLRRQDNCVLSAKITTIRPSVDQNSGEQQPLNGNVVRVNERDVSHQMDVSVKSPPPCSKPQPSRPPKSP